MDEISGNCILKFDGKGLFSLYGDIILPIFSLGNNFIGVAFL